jgi:hypothetical protein
MLTLISLNVINVCFYTCHICFTKWKEHLKESKYSTQADKLDYSSCMYILTERESLVLCVSEELRFSIMTEWENASLNV